MDSVHDNILKKDTLNTPLDTIGGKKKNRIKKPFNSYLFADSVKKTAIIEWNISLSDATAKIVPMDTVLADFQKNYIFMKKNRTGVASVGPLGGAVMPLNYADRYDNYENSFTNPYGDYFLTPETASFYNSKTSFTQFEYMTSGQRQYAEEHLFVNHAQNISPSTSIDLFYRNNRKRGHYTNQRAINKNLSINLAHTGRRYSLFAGYINNIADIIDNGGVTDITNVTDTTLNPATVIPVNLKATNDIRGNQFYITQAYVIPLRGNKMDSTTNLNMVPSLSVGMSLNYSSYKKIYEDTKTDVGEYFDDWYLNSSRSLDSIHEKNTDIKFFSKYQPLNKYAPISSITAGVGYTNEQYYNFNPQDYISPTGVNTRNSLYVYGGIDGNYYQFFNWKGYAKYYPIGDRNQDIEFGGNINVNLGDINQPTRLKFAAEISTTTPSYWTENYISNHYIWNNDFKKEFKMKYDFNFRIDKINLEIGYTQTFETDKVFYNALSLPEQCSTTVSVSSFFIKKDFEWKGINLQHRAQVQLSSDQKVAPVPLLALNLTYFYELVVVKNVLTMQLGVDGYYNTEYYGPGYNPALGQFYNQQDTKLGNYPTLDFFVTGKWKKLRFLLKMQNVSYGWFNTNAFQVKDHPLNRSMFTFGFSWNFYD